ncbi:hypothetical protein EBU71_06865 [bacterium]|nr:hypothetical protein [Candidatus Elulimicrobium humile]
MIYLFVFLSQIFFNVGKVLEIKLTYENKTRGLIINTLVINLISLLSVFYSIENLLKGDTLVVLFYVSGAVVGKWFGMTQVENYRHKILSLFKNGNKNY